MKIAMTGIDHKTADLELRESVGFTVGQIKELLPKIKSKYELSGVVLISTCNRTEMYVSYKEGKVLCSPRDMLCEAAGVVNANLHSCFQTRWGEAACSYLFEVASGIHSLLFGDDQIVTQVRGAVELAQEMKVSDAKLNSLFRNAITCAKIVKSRVVLKGVSTSVATQCRSVLSEFTKTKPKAKVVVIGNGAIGRLVCHELYMAGCDVYVTFRQYKHHDLQIPHGCKAIDYAERENYFEGADIVVSATASPHYTVTYKMIDSLQCKPKYLFDLAVPRDIEPQVKDIAGVLHYDIDSMGTGAQKDNSKEVAEVLSLVGIQLGKFYDWLKVHECRGNIDVVKSIVVPKIVRNIDKRDSREAQLEQAVDKTLDFVLYSFKEQLSDEMLVSLHKGALAKK